MDCANSVEIHRILPDLSATNRLALVNQAISDHSIPTTVRWALCGAVSLHGVISGEESLLVSPTVILVIVKGIYYVVSDRRDVMMQIA